MHLDLIKEIDGSAGLPALVQDTDHMFEKVNHHIVRPHDRDLCYVVLLGVCGEAAGFEHDMTKATVFSIEILKTLAGTNYKNIYFCCQKKAKEQIYC